ncbi:MAG: TonB-dependent receptor [Vicinamibacterales bacterium]
MRPILLAIVFVITLVVSPAFAQQGQINGVITDSSGGIVPGVTVTAVEQQTGLSRDTVTGANGRYTFPALRPTIYEIRAVLTGFRTIRRTGIELSAYQNVTVNVALELGELSETISVAGNAAQVDVTSATISEVVDHARIVELPLNGRDATKLTTLVAGTVISSVSTETGKTIPGALRLSSNGSEALSVSFRLDGTSNTDLYEHENLTFPFPEALQEFSIQTSNYSAAQGNSSGAVINAVTRSGTNSYHGGAFGYVRNKAFNSRNYFAAEPDALDRRQYGGFLGGPVKLPGYDGTNRTFFFLGWQGTLVKNTTATTTVFAPTNDQRAGNFATCGAPCNAAIRDPLTGQPFPGNQIPVSRYDPASVKLMSHFAQLTGTGQHQVSRASAMDFNQVVLKVDQQLTTNNQLSGRYFIDHFDNAAIITPGDLLSYRTGSPESRVRSQSGVVSWKRTMTPTLLNETHLGFQRMHAGRVTPPTPSLQELGIRLPLYPTTPNIQLIDVTGFFSVGADAPSDFVRNGVEFSNRTNWMKGKHSIQFGAEGQYYKATIDSEYRVPGTFVFNGSATGNAMADFMLGDMRSFDQGTGEYKDNTNFYSSAFFQDDYKVHPRLSLNIGFRYEPTPPWHEEVGRIQTFDLEAYRAGRKTTLFDNAPPGVFFRGDPGVPEDGTLGDFNNVSFRGGAAWDLAGDGKTSLRGGWGMFYDQHIIGRFNNGATNNPPWSIRVNVTEPVGPFSNPYLGRTDFDVISLDGVGRRDAPFPYPVAANSYDGQFNTPLTYNYNLTLEREIFSGWMARAAYVGSRTAGGHNTISLNPAIYVPGATTGTTDARRALQPYGALPTYVQQRWSKYNAMQLTLNRRFSRGLTINSNYTLASTVGNFGDELIPYFMHQDPALVEGPLDQMRRHRFVTSWVFDLPDVGDGNAVVRGALNGWQLTGIIQFQTGSPFTITTGTDISRDGIGGDRAKTTGVSMDPPAGSDQTLWFNPAAFAAGDVGTFGDVAKGAYFGPSTYYWDMGLSKNMRFGDDMGVQFRAEFFNIFNHVNFANPATTVNSASFGRITSTHANQGDPRIMQFGLKFVF